MSGSLIAPPLRFGRRLRRAVRRYGVLGLVREAAGTWRSRDAARRYAEVERRFDEEHDVDTAGIVRLHELEIGSLNREFGNRYEAVPPDRLRELLHALPIDPRRFTFLDVGSGKGRALFLAAALPFRRIVGVEFSPELEALARANVERFMRKSAYGGSIESVCEDATAYDLPPEPLVIHFFNPFEEQVMRVMFDRIRRSVEARPRDVILVFSGRVPAVVESDAAFPAVEDSPAGLFWATPAA